MEEMIGGTVQEKDLIGTALADWLQTTGQKALTGSVKAVGDWWARSSADQEGIHDDLLRLVAGGVRNTTNAWKAGTADQEGIHDDFLRGVGWTVGKGMQVLDAGSYYGGKLGGNIARMVGVDPRLGGFAGNILGDVAAGGVIKRAVTIGKTAQTLKHLQKTNPLAAMQADHILKAGKGQGYAFAYAGEGFEQARPGLMDAVTASGKTHKKVAKVRKASKLDDLARRWQQADNLTPSEFAELKKDLGKLNLRDKNSVISSPRGGDIKEATTVDFMARRVGEVPTAAHHRAGLDVTGTPLERLGPRGNRIRDQVNLGAVTGETRYNYMAVADTFTSGTRRQRLENVLNLTFEHVDETRFSKPVLRRDLKRSYNDAYGVSDLDFGEVKKGVIPPPAKGSYPIVRGPDGEDILRIQNNIDPNSPITTRIWNERFNHISDYYGIDRKHLKGRKGLINPRSDRIAGDHGYIHEAIRLAQDDPNTALGKLQQLGAFDRKMNTTRQWDNISDSEAVRLLTQSVREQNQIALYVAADKVKRIKAHPVLGKLWKNLSGEQIPEFMEQYSMDIAGLGWYDMAKGVNKKKLRQMLSQTTNTKSEDYKRLKAAFMLEDLPTAYSFKQMKRRTQLLAGSKRR